MCPAGCFIFIFVSLIDLVLLYIYFIVVFLWEDQIFYNPSGPCIA